MSYGVGLRNGVAFALGTIPSLTSGGGLRPSLLLNFLSGTLDSRITFTRGTTATYYGSDGLLASAAINAPRFDYDPTNYVRQNLLTYSEQFDNAAWFKGNTTVLANQATSPDGTVTADSVSFLAVANANIQQSATVTVGAAYTYSVYVRADSAVSNVKLSMQGTDTAISVGTTWSRVSMTLTASGTTLTPTLVTRDSVPVTIYVWGAQLNTGSTALTYTATTIAPYTLVAARGLLIEEQRVNLLLQSNDFQTSWGLTNVTRTLAATTGPDGTLSGVKIEATTAAATQILQGAVVAAKSATGSVYVKQGTGATIGNTFVLRNVTTATNLVAGTLNYSTGVFTYVTGSTGVVVTSVGNGWWRISISATAGITSGDQLQWFPGWASAVAAAGDFIYLYGAQLEAGAFATSYIPTVGSQVTRAADSASITTLTPWYNSAAGTLFASVSYESATSGVTGDYNVAISNGTVSNIVLIGSVGAVACQVISGGVTSYGQNIGTRPAIGVTQKTAFAYTTNNANQAVNGVLGSDDTTVVVPSAVTKLSVGQRGDNSSYLNGWISNLSYYPTRLPNATLQGLTV